MEIVIPPQQPSTIDPPEIGRKERRKGRGEKKEEGEPANRTKPTCFSLRRRRFYATPKRGGKKGKGGKKKKGERKREGAKGEQGRQAPFPLLFRSIRSAKKAGRHLREKRKKGIREERKGGGRGRQFPITPPQLNLLAPDERGKKKKRRKEETLPTRGEEGGEGKRRKKKKRGGVKRKRKFLPLIASAREKGKKGKRKKRGGKMGQSLSQKASSGNYIYLPLLQLTTFSRRGMGGGRGVAAASLTLRLKPMARCRRRGGRKKEGGAVAPLPILLSYPPLSMGRG